MDIALSLLQRGVSEVFPDEAVGAASESLAQRLRRSVSPQLSARAVRPSSPSRSQAEGSSRQTDRPLRIKLGIDPTAADIHLGHSISMRKLRAFQDAGHVAVVIIGDFTAQIGDPTGKSDVRRQLTAAEVAENAQTYLDQMRLILDFDTPGRLEVCYNSQWLAQLDLAKIAELLATMTVGQMLAKEGFAERYEQGIPVYLHEFLYPLMQGYDSVAVRADVELGATDQKFNIAVGRDLQRHFGQPPQYGLLVPILLGTGGVQKMSKSLNNYIGLSEDPITMYSKLEKTPDAVLLQYFELLTDLPLDQLPENPRDRQKLLALQVTSQYHGQAAAQKAQQQLAAMVTQKDMTQASLVPEFSLAQVQFPAKLFYLISASGLCKTSSEARRQIQGGAVRLGGDRVEQVDLTFESPAELQGQVLQVGKKKFVRLVLE